MLQCQCISSFYNKDLDNLTLLYQLYILDFGWRYLAFVLSSIYISLCIKLESVIEAKPKAGLAGGVLRCGAGREVFPLSGNTASIWHLTMWRAQWRRQEFTFITSIKINLEGHIRVLWWDCPAHRPLGIRGKYRASPIILIVCWEHW